MEVEQVTSRLVPTWLHFCQPAPARDKRQVWLTRPLASCWHSGKDEATSGEAGPGWADLIRRLGFGTPPTSPNALKTKQLPRLSSFSDGKRVSVGAVAECPLLEPPAIPKHPVLCTPLPRLHPPVRYTLAFKAGSSFTSERLPWFLQWVRQLPELSWPHAHPSLRALTAPSRRDSYCSYSFMWLSSWSRGWESWGPRPASYTAIGAEQLLCKHVWLGLPWWSRG